MPSSYEILNLKSQIEVETAFNDWKLDYGLFSLGYPTGLMTEDAAQSGIGSRFVAFVGKIISSVKRVLHDLMTSFTNIFKKRATPEELLKSKGIQQNFNMDVEKVKGVVDGEMREGCRLLQLASSKTGLPDTLIEPYLTKGAQKLQSVVNVPKMIEGAVATRVARSLNAAVNDADAHFTTAEKFAKNIANPDTMGKGERILKHMVKCSNLLTKSFGQVLNMFKKPKS